MMSCEDKMSQEATLEWLSKCTSNSTIHNFQDRLQYVTYLAKDRLSSKSFYMLKGHGKDSIRSIFLDLRTSLGHN